jgi:glycosyltransferase involved in cell wall biosynthesis
MKKKILLVIPVYNEEEILPSSIKKLHLYMRRNIKEEWKILIANNGSTDRTLEIAKKLSDSLDNILVFSTSYKGRGNALKKAFTENNADIYAYCDVDLATDIKGLKTLFLQITNGYDISLGSRYIKGSNYNRNIKRLILSKGYNYFARLFFKTKITDFQCGFKAVNHKVCRQLVPLIKDKTWFFDTELLIKAECRGYKIAQVPVRWNENKRSKVIILRTILDYIIKIIKLRMDL